MVESSVSTLIDMTMSSQQEPSWETMQSLADNAVLKDTGRHLSDREVQVLKGCFDNKTYQRIADELYLTHDFINGDIAYKLWKKLSHALGEKVSRRNFRGALGRELERQTARSSQLDIADLEYPEGVMSLKSPFYIERHSERQCYRELLKPGCLIRIRSPKKTGKTSLLKRVLEHAKKQGYQTVHINLETDVDEFRFSNSTDFLRWFCTYINKWLEVECGIEQHWDEESGVKPSCNNYLQALLKIVDKGSNGLVIAIDDLDYILSYPETARDFFTVLRAWNDKTKDSNLWEKLRLILVYSTEIYIPLNIHQSPFNIGKPIDLLDFSQEQVEALAKLHGLDWNADDESKKLMSMVGGHPYLIRKALYYLNSKQNNLEEFLQEAPTCAGIYSGHLRDCLKRLQERPELVQALEKVIESSTPVQLEPMLNFPLVSMGLVRLEGNCVTPSYELYRQYFSVNLT